MMHLAGPLSKYYDESAVVAPTRRGHVAWSSFNEHYDRFQRLPWSRINEGVSHTWWRRVLRLWMAFWVQRTGALLDLETKARVIARLALPRDPNIVFFGAEVGWEAFLVRALFGDRGRCVLVDADPRAYQRFQASPSSLEIAAPSRTGKRRLVLERDPRRIEYVQEDFFDWTDPEGFDLGIDWGLLEHYPAADKPALLARFRANLKPGALELSAVPRDTRLTRLFYSTFPDELNFGYRELLSPEEHASVLRQGGFQVMAVVPTRTTSIALARRDPAPES